MIKGNGRFVQIHMVAAMLAMSIDCGMPLEGSLPDVRDDRTKPDPQRHEAAAAKRARKAAKRLKHMRAEEFQ